MIGKIKGLVPFLGLVVTQVASAAGLMILLQLLFLRILPAHEFSWYRYLLELLVLMPFILFPTPAGFFSDKYPKEKVLRVTSFAAFLIALLVGFSFYAGFPPGVVIASICLFRL